MFNPCKNCMVKGNCTTECKTYTKYQKTMAETLSILSLITSAVIIILLLIFFPSSGLIIWIGSFIFCHVIPMISNETGFWTAAIFGPFIFLVFIIATITRPYVMRPVAYRNYKKRTLTERFFGINRNKRA